MKNMFIKKIKLLTLIIFQCSYNIYAQANWNENYLIEQWRINGRDEIEGIYENTKEEVGVFGKASLALIKTELGYNLINLSTYKPISKFINGREVCISYGWNVGDIKAILTNTSTAYLFKTKWYTNEKKISENLQITFETGIMRIIWTDSSSEQLYIKLFPAKSTPINRNYIKYSGTGFALTSNGYIVTNYHIVEDAASITVRGVNGNLTIPYLAKIIISDKKNDLAIIKIEDTAFTSISRIPYTIKLSSSEVGENVFVLGYPLRASMGDEIKLTNGIISSMTGFQGDITSYQISAPVQPGNSGGPLFDKFGNLIGIINAKHTKAENVSYAIKVSYLKNVIDLLQIKPPVNKTNTLSNLTLTDQVKRLNKFVYIIEIK